MGLMFANGGPQATKGSLMCKNGVNLQLERQDDVGKMQEALITFATELSRGNKNPSGGAHFVAIMGDGSAAFLSGLNKNLEKIGSQYRAKVIGSCGYSRGEDKFMGPPSWKTTPSASKGGVVSGYLRDGDWNNAQKWLGDNGLRNNPNEKTYDPDALNWIAANDYIDACQKYITGYTETRPVVRNGKPTGETKQIHVDAVVTWTPGDVQVAQQKGGLISIVSTKEYASQMPNTIIGIDKWMKDNRSTVEGMLGAIMEGGDAVKGNPLALTHAAKISQQVYKESNADAAYWEKYYKGTVEKDKQGLSVELGGSSVNNLEDNVLLFGLQSGAANLFATTYRVFGDVVVKQYPDIMPSYAPVEQILDTSYVANLSKRAGVTAKDVRTAAPTYTAKSSTPAPEISRKQWKINFSTGSAAFAGSRSTLEQLKNDLLIASGAAVEIHGHTDNVGDPNKNQALSESRAFAVRNWLMKSAPVNFPESRIRVYAHGQTNPIAPNSTDAGRARNRRVEIVLKASGA
jgi:outer membrane protein OmpA-like peptidoglycan-associated protein